MKETVMANKALFVDARERAKTLIENYIKQIGEACGKEYSIVFIDVDSENSAAEEEVEEQD